MELRELVALVQEHLRWQRACGCAGVTLAGVTGEYAAQGGHSEGVEEDAAVDTAHALAEVSQSVHQREQFEAEPPTPVRVATQSVDKELGPTQRLALLEQRDRETRRCEQCSLHQRRTRTVYGVGPINPDVMIIGEGPGADEDAQGIPFVGKAGQLLDKMIAAMGYQREQFYICNIVKCRPPNNRRPQDEEIAACLPLVREQVELVNPKVILAMGATAIRGLLGRSGITSLRGTWFLYDSRVPLMPTFHPAYLLREPRAKRLVWNDLKAVMGKLGKPVGVASASGVSGAGDTKPQSP